MTRQINEQLERTHGALPPHRLLSHQYLWELINGRKDNPTLFVLEALATYLEVSVDYLAATDPATDPDPTAALTAQDRAWLREHGWEHKEPPGW